jgi:hypothetical protein
MPAKMYVIWDEVGGLFWAAYATRLSYNSCPANYCVTDVTNKDINLLSGLAKKGPSEGKGLRAIQVWATIRAPRYFWCQMDTYKVGTVTLSQSTMHTLGRKYPILPSDFCIEIPQSYLDEMNRLSLEAGNEDIVKGMLPESYMQIRGVNLNYQVLRHIYQDRKNHRLKEWHIFCDAIKELPYAEELIMPT